MRGHNIFALICLITLSTIKHSHSKGNRVNKIKIVFLLASISQPRCLKRVDSFVKKGYEVEVYGFNREVYQDNVQNNNFTINDLGYSASGTGYFKKMLRVKKILSKIFDKNINDDVVYYAFSFDIALICKFFSKKKYIYEISDLVYTYFSSQLLVTCFKLIDLTIIKRSLLTVLTSQGYEHYLFPKQKIENIIVQPNRLPSNIFNSELKRSSRRDSSLVFAYVGAFRYPDTVFRFARVIGEKYPDYKFYFWGDSNIKDLKNLATSYSHKFKNVECFGPFKNPDDLEAIYNKIDVVVACYDTSSLNERVAEPNKFYEALYFHKPIVVSKGTFLAERVHAFDCGYSINADNDNDICLFVESLTKMEISAKKANIKKVCLKEIIDDDSIEIIEFIESKL